MENLVIIQSLREILEQHISPRKLEMKTYTKNFVYVLKQFTEKGSRSRRTEEERPTDQNISNEIGAFSMSFNRLTYELSNNPLYFTIE